MRIGIPVSDDGEKYNINIAYIKYILAAKYEPVLIVPDMDYKSVFDTIDGLILPGGIDVDPIYYGDDNDNSLITDPSKDAFERALLTIARKTKCPVFGICRGFQLIIREYMLENSDSYDFLDFYQHLPSHNQTGRLKLERSTHMHYVDINRKGLYGSGKVPYMSVNSMHHQALVVDFGNRMERSRNDFEMLAWTERGLEEELEEDDRIGSLVCEAYSLGNFGTPILAVQWHPEELLDTALITNFFGRRKK